MDRLKFHGVSLAALWYVLIAICAMVLIVPAAAQETVTDDDVNEIAKEVYCPVCESTPLDVCETKACADWRELIRTKLGEGQTKQQIFDYFATQYGDRVLASPPREGMGLVLWLWPFVAFFIGIIFFGRYVRSLKTAPVVEGAENQLINSEAESDLAAIDDYAARIEDELARK